MSQDIPSSSKYPVVNCMEELMAGCACLEPLGYHPSKEEMELYAGFEKDYGQDHPFFKTDHYYLFDLHVSSCDYCCPLMHAIEVEYGLSEPDDPLAGQRPLNNPKSPD